MKKNDIETKINELLGDDNAWMLEAFDLILEEGGFILDSQNGLLSVKSQIEEAIREGDIIPYKPCIDINKLR